jgi:hypothetical protein
MYTFILFFYLLLLIYFLYPVDIRPEIKDILQSNYIQKVLTKHPFTNHYLIQDC